MAQDWGVHALVYFCSAVDNLFGAVFYGGLDLEFAAMTKDEALKLALETLECWQRNEDCNEPMSKILEAIKEALAQPEEEPLLQDIEKYRVQMAGISTAALGYWKEGDGIHPDYDTLALHDVAKLYAKYDELYKAQPEQKPAATLAVRWHPPVGKVAYVLEVDLPIGIHKLYASPPQRQWVGLTEEEVIEISRLALTRVQAVQMTAATLKEKNT